MENTMAPSGPEAAARRAQLVHVNDAEPGYRRRRAGKGFTYRDEEGRRITDPEALARIRALAIPPAWTEVWICPDRLGHIQATGRDERGRKQYRYHADWTAHRSETKFSNLSAFARALPKLRKRIEADLRRRGLPRERIIASVVWLLDNTMIRIGNDAYARENRSFGLTTLRARHVEVEGTSIRFAFKGKSGRAWRLKLSDRRIGSIVRAIQDLPGQHLFQYLDEEGGRHELRSQDVNDYIRDAIGPEFSSRHFRTWGGTVTAAGLLADTPLPDSQREQARALNTVLDQVAARLNNTRTVCRQCYVHPAISEVWSEGRFGDEMRALRARYPKPFTGLDTQESTMLRWLSAQ